VIEPIRVAPTRAMHTDPVPVDPAPNSLANLALGDTTTYPAHFALAATILSNHVPVPARVTTADTEHIDPDPGDVASGPTSVVPANAVPIDSSPSDVVGDPVLDKPTPVEPVPVDPNPGDMRFNLVRVTLTSAMHTVPILVEPASCDAAIDTVGATFTSTVPTKPAFVEPDPTIAAACSNRSVLRSRAHIRIDSIHFTPADPVHVDPVSVTIGDTATTTIILPGKFRTRVEDLFDIRHFAIFCFVLLSCFLEVIGLEGESWIGNVDVPILVGGVWGRASCPSLGA
jgi:hypothetical protein